MENTRPLRIVLIGNAASVNVRNWADGLRATGADIQIITFHEPPAPFSYIHIVGIPRALRKLRYFVGVPGVRRVLASLQPDVVIGYFATGYGTTAALSGWQPLVIVTAGSDLFVAPQRNPVIGAVMRWNLRRARLVVALAPHMAEALQNFGIPNARILTLAHGIALERFTRCAEPTAGEPLRIISTRSLLPIYNLSALLDALPLLVEIPHTVTVAGDGPLRETLAAQALRLPIPDAVRFVGVIGYADLPNLLAGSNVYISLTPSEGVSASLLEAMAAGLTPVVTDIAANRHWVEEGKNGLLLPDTQPATIAAALRRAYTDVELRRRAFETNPRIVAERGDIVRNAVLYVSRFESLCDHSRTHPDTDS